MTMPRRSVQVLLVVALAVAAFAPSLGGELVSDDGALIRSAAGDLGSSVSRRFWDVRGEGEVPGLYGHAYRPVAQLMLALEQRVFGSDPAPYHALNLLLHALNAWLVLRFLSRRLRAIDGRLSVAGELSALLAALLFAVHPAHAGSVAWISGATDLWMTLGLLLGCELLERGRAGRLLAPLAFACAVLAKEPAVVAPVLCGLDAWARRSPRAVARAQVAACASGAGVAAALTLWVGAGSAGHSPLHFDASSALALTGHFVRMALLPTHLVFEAQPYLVDADGIHLAPSMIALGAATWALGGTALVLAVRGQRARELCADAAWFFGPLLPVVVLHQTMLADRFLYAPLLGLCALCARVLQRTFEAGRAQRGLSWVVASAAIALALVYAPRAARAFADEEALWRSQATAYPDNPKALDALGEALQARGKHGEARASFERGMLAAHAIGQRAVALHFLAHLIALPVIERPEWDEQAAAETARGCRSLFGERRAQYARGAQPLTLDLAPAELGPLERRPALLLGPCARALLGLKALDVALRFTQRAEQVAPRDVAAAEIHALVLARAGRYDQALAQAARARTLLDAPQLAELAARIEAARDASSASVPPSDARGLALRAFDVAMILGSPRAARRALAAALSAAPDDHQLVHALVQSFVAERRFDRARETIAAAKARQPADEHWGAMLGALEEAEAALAGAGNAARPPSEAAHAP